MFLYTVHHVHTVYRYEKRSPFITTGENRIKFVWQHLLGILCIYNYYKEETFWTVYRLLCYFIWTIIQTHTTLASSLIFFFFLVSFFFFLFYIIIQCLPIYFYNTAYFKLMLMQPDKILFFYQYYIDVHVLCVCVCRSGIE